MPKLKLEFRDGRIEDFLNKTDVVIPLFVAKVDNFTLQMDQI